MNDTTKTTLQMEDGNWEIHLKGDHCQIIDAQGRQRHTSRGHKMTAAHLAMQLAKQPFVSVENLDAALKELAKRFTTEGP